jgi:hypothetical protein
MWSGASWNSDGREAAIIVVPFFWALSALSVSAAAWAWIDRRRTSMALLSFAIVGYASLWIAGVSILDKSGPMTYASSLRNYQQGLEPASYVAVAAIALALAVVVWSPKRYSNERA